MRIYVTGSTGFIGSAFIRRALAHGHEISSPAKTERLAHPQWPAIRAFAPEACVHTAWITKPGKYLTSPENSDFARWSVSFLEKMLEAGTRHLVGLGTCVEYAPTTVPMHETESDLTHGSAYAASKNEVRAAMEPACAEHGATFSWARIFYPYGPGEHPRRLSSEIIAALRRNEPVCLKTPYSLKDYIYVDDVASALLAIVEARYHGPINVGTGNGTAIRDIAGKLGALLGKKHLIHEAEPPAPDLYPCVIADSTRLRSLHWVPKFSLDAGLFQLVKSVP